ncbi:MAG: acyl-CoA thioesterase [Planctomycetia bacterium]
MPDIYEHRLTVDHEAIDLLGHVNNVVYLQWLLDAAVAHSAAQGWNADRHLRLGAGWVVRSHQIEYLQPAFRGDKITVRTWVSDFKKISSHRRYHILRHDEEDETLLVTAKTKWAFVDYATGEPVRIPKEIAESFTVVDHP